MIKPEQDSKVEKQHLLLPLNRKRKKVKKRIKKGRLMSLDCGFGTSCLLHCCHLTVSANSEDN